MLAFFEGTLLSFELCFLVHLLRSKGAIRDGKTCLVHQTGFLVISRSVGSGSHGVEKWSYALWRRRCGCVSPTQALDKSVAEATENRKAENAEYKELMTTDTTAKEILGFAKNRLNKFYNPKPHT